MKICDLATGVGGLTHAFGELKERWLELKSHWHDDAARKFEETHLQPLPGKLRQMFAAAQRLGETLERAGNDLGDGRET